MFLNTHIKKKDPFLSLVYTTFYIPHIFFSYFSTPCVHLASLLLSCLFALLLLLLVIEEKKGTSSFTDFIYSTPSFAFCTASLGFLYMQTAQDRLSHWSCFSPLVIFFFLEVFLLFLTRFTLFFCLSCFSFVHLLIYSQLFCVLLLLFLFDVCFTLFFLFVLTICLTGLYSPFFGWQYL